MKKKARKQSTRHLSLTGLASVTWLLMTLLALHHAQGAEVKTQLYTEQGFLTQENSMIQSLRIRTWVPLEVSLKPFIQVGSELMTLGLHRHKLDEGSSFFYYGPGLSWQIPYFQALVEWRQRAFYNDELDQKTRDLRATLIYNWQSFSRLMEKWLLYQEVYGEGVLTSADEGNTIVSGWGRLGIRHNASASWIWDTYLEPFATVDTLGRVYNRRLEIRPSLRAQYFVEKIALGLTGALVLPIRGKIQSGNALNERNIGFRILATIGGDL